MIVGGAHGQPSAEIAVDRALMGGRIHLPEGMHTGSDAQVYVQNWVSRLDRPTVDISSYCSVDTG